MGPGLYRAFSGLSASSHIFIGRAEVSIALCLLSFRLRTFFLVSGVEVEYHGEKNVLILRFAREIPIPPFRAKLKTSLIKYSILNKRWTLVRTIPWNFPAENGH